jgi:O-acetyl-ADP-ribose deacetylase (regulator of RNase III)
MITYKKGNLINATEDIIAHQVNCQGVMESGLAQQIADKYLNVATEYLSLCNSHKHKRTSSDLLGTIQNISIPNNKFICNLFGQFNYGYGGQFTEYEHLSNALHSLKEDAKESNRTVALPFMLGCGNGGGDWDTVVSIIHEAFKDYDVSIYSRYNIPNYMQLNK